MSDATLSHRQEDTLTQILAALKALEAQLKPDDAIENLPPELGRNRILDTKQAVKFLNISVAEWRRQRRDPEVIAVAPPVMLGKRKQGWRVGNLIDLQDCRTQKAPVDEPRRDPHLLTREPARA